MKPGETNRIEHKSSLSRELDLEKENKWNQNESK